MSDGTLTGPDLCVDAADDYADASAAMLDELEECEESGRRIEACSRCNASGCRYCADTGYVPTAYAIADDAEEEAFVLGEMPEAAE